jgi:hypothetical protein
VEDARTSKADYKQSSSESPGIDDYLNIPSDQAEPGSPDVEVENKQFNYDLPQKNTQNYIPQSKHPTRNRSSVIKRSLSYRDENESNLSNSFKIDHKKAEIKRKKYSKELEKLKKKSNSKKLKTTTRNTRKKKGDTSRRNHKTSDKKKELKEKVERVKKNDNGKDESIFNNLLSLNIVENITLRYVVAIISGIVVFGIIFTGLGLISNF